MSEMTGQIMTSFVRWENSKKDPTLAVFVRWEPGNSRRICCDSCWEFVQMTVVVKVSNFQWNYCYSNLDTAKGQFSNNFRCIIFRKIKVLTCGSAENSGKFPPMLLLCRSMYLRYLNRPEDLGMVPYILLLARFRYCSCDKLSKLGGKEAVMTL